MDETTLIRGLESLRPPAVDGAEERCRARLRGIATPPARRGRLFLTAHPRLAASLCALAAVVGLGSLTAPGQAVATWVAGQVGIGEPGGEPTLQKMRAKMQVGTGAAGRPTYVIASGPTPVGGHFELLTYSSREVAPGAGLVQCFELNLTKLRALYGGSCEFGIEKLGRTGDVRITSAGGGTSLHNYRSLLSIVGVASADIESVAVNRGDRSFPTELQSVPAELALSLGFERPFKVYAAFDTRPLRGRGPIEVRGFDADGELAVHRRQEGSAALGSAGLLRHLCRWARRRAAAGKLSAKSAHRTCRTARLTIRHGS